MSNTFIMEDEKKGLDKYFTVFNIEDYLLDQMVRLSWLGISKSDTKCNNALNIANFV